MVNTKEFYDYLIANKLDFFTGVPDSLLKELCLCIKDNSLDSNNIIAANEGNAIALATGYHLSTGKLGVVYMQNSGEGNIINPLLSLADPKVYSIPMLLIIGWRGEPGVHDEPQHVKQGEVTLSLLDAMSTPYEVLDDKWQKQLDKMIKLSIKENKPTAVIIKKGLFDKYVPKKPISKIEMGNLLREEALEVILKNISDDIVVSTTGKESREIFEIRERWNQDHKHDFLTVGSMGHTSSIALGLSLGTQKTIWCLDGDGSFIMHMGSMAIAANNASGNFKYIVNNNSAHESVGGQPTVGGYVNMKEILHGCGFKNIFEAHTSKQIEKAIIKMKKCGKCALILYTKQGSRDNLGRPTISPVDNKKDFMELFK